MFKIFRNPIYRKLEKLLWERAERLVKERLEGKTLEDVYDEVSDAFDDLLDEEVPKVKMAISEYRNISRYLVSEALKRAIKFSESRGYSIEDGSFTNPILL